MAFIHEDCNGVFIKEVGKDWWTCSLCKIQGNYASVKRMSIPRGGVYAGILQVLPEMQGRHAEEQ